MSKLRRSTEPANAYRADDQTPARPLFVTVFVLSLAALIATTLWFIPRAASISDMNVYAAIAKGIATATDEIASEYPPLVSALLHGVQSAAGDRPFSQAWVIFVLAMLVASSLYAVWRRGPGAFFFPLGVLATGFLIGQEMVFARYDVLVLILIFLSWQALARKRSGEGAFWLAIAAALKLVPALIFPLLLIGAPRTEWKRLAAGTAAGLALALAVPLAVLGWNGTVSNVRYMTTYHAERGIQIESFWSSADMLARNATGSKAVAEFHHASTHNMSLGTKTALAATVTVMLGLLGLYWLRLRDRKRADAAADDRTAAWWTAGLAWAVAMAPVFSPQYLVWVLPILAVWLLDEYSSGRLTRDTRRIGFLALAIGALTLWIYPHHYGSIINGGELPASLILAARNASMVALAWLLACHAAGLPPTFMARPEVAPVEPLRFAIPEWLTRPSAWLRTAGARRLVTAGALVFMLAFTAGVCAFKVMDRDYWWHITAGKIMVTEQRWIELDPFAYAREGLEYISTHEWLAQVVLYLVNAAGGSTGIIIFRTLLILMAAAFVLAIDRKRLWPNVFIAAYVVSAARPGFMDRPQLFTFVLISAFVWLACHILDDDQAGSGEKGSKRENLLWLFIPLEILWVNFHGGAALVGIGIVGALFMQRAVDWAFASTPQERAALGHGVRRAAAISVLTALCFFATPSGWHNMSFLVTLLTDKTVEFISEWKPRKIGDYLADYAIVWAVGLAALSLCRRKLVFSIIVFVAMGALSLKAFRHEMLFAFAAGGLVIYQLKHSPRWNAAVDWVSERAVPFTLANIMLFVTVVGVSMSNFHHFAARDHLYGYGTFDLARGAADYVENNALTGKMFNTYGIGGYFIYRGYPDRKVYIDGRNVDYGFDYMGRTFVAQDDPKAWESLVKRFDFSYAVIDYDAIREWNTYPFVDHLAKNPEWKMVYLDDWSAVYLKANAENAALIERDGLTVATPQSITTGFAADLAKPEELDRLKWELERIIRENPDGVKARLSLAKLQLRQDDPIAAEATLRAALAIQPLRAVLREHLGDALAAQQRWTEAVREYRLADFLTLDPFSPEDYEKMSAAFSNAGNARMAQKYLEKSGRAPKIIDRLPDLGPQDADKQALAEKLLAQLQESQGSEVERLLDEGIRYAQSAQPEKALESFNAALKIDPRSAAAWSNIGAVYLQQKKFAEAETALQQAVTLNESLPDAHYNMALALYQLGRYDEALESAKRALELGKDTSAMIKALESRQ